MNARSAADQKTIVAAMSGGVDSAVTAGLLKKDGHDVVGITLQIWQEHAEQGSHGGCCSLGAVEDARRASAAIGIPHYVLNFKDHFGRQVIDRFVSEYAAGRTPNPCVECNRSVKFDELLKQAEGLGADLLATGHYARIRLNAETGLYELLKARDAAKDQSYFLFTMTQRQLAATLMPLGELSGKSETRRLAREMGLALADKPDSQEICFVPKEGYTRFLAEKAPETHRSGEIVTSDGTPIGSHQGVANYTIGQRKRLPASNSGPLYVLRLDAATRRVVVGSDAELYETQFAVGALNWISGSAPALPLAVSARIRYNAEAVSAVISSSPLTGEVQCTFETPQRAVTPGQAAVFYLDDVVLGGGAIERTGASTDTMPQE